MTDDSQYRPPHRQDAPAYEGDEPVLAALEAPSLSIAESIEEMLLESGIGNSSLLDRLTALVRELAMREAADALHEVCAKLDGTAGGVALRRVLSGAAGDSLADAGNEAGVSKQCIAKHEGKIRKRLGLTKVPTYGGMKPRETIYE